VTRWESIGEWLHEHPSRTIFIRAAGYSDEEGNWQPRHGVATFVLTTRLPDGRKVQSSVQMIDEVLGEPLAGDMIVHEAKTAIEHLLGRERSQECD
jgi:hypothetical protein